MGMMFCTPCNERTHHVCRKVNTNWITESTKVDVIKCTCSECNTASERSTPVITESSMHCPKCNAKTLQDVMEGFKDGTISCTCRICNRTTTRIRKGEVK